MVKNLANVANGRVVFYYSTAGVNFDVVVNLGSREVGECSRSNLEEGGRAAGQSKVVVGEKLAATWVCGWEICGAGGGR